MKTKKLINFDNIIRIYYVPLFLSQIMIIHYEKRNNFMETKGLINFDNKVKFIVFKSFFMIDKVLIKSIQFDYHKFYK